MEIPIRRQKTIFAKIYTKLPQIHFLKFSGQILGEDGGLPIRLRCRSQHVVAGVYRFSTVLCWSCVVLEGRHQMAHTLRGPLHASTEKVDEGPLWSGTVGGIAERS